MVSATEEIKLKELVDGTALYHPCTKLLVLLIMNKTRTPKLHSICVVIERLQTGFVKYFIISKHH